MDGNAGDGDIAQEDGDELQLSVLVAYFLFFFSFLYFLGGNVPKDRPKYH